MKRIYSVLFLALSLFFLFGCELIPVDFGGGGGTTVVDPPIVDPPVVDPETVTVKVFMGDNEVGSGEYDCGSELNIPNPDEIVTSDNTYTYMFIGWDANGDNVPETFPYTLNEDVTFRAIYETEYINYEYSIYVNDELVVHKTDAHYLDDIAYPNDESVTTHWVGEDIIVFLGWEYNGVFDGLIYAKIDRNLVIRAKFADSQILKLYFDNHIYANLIDAGQTITFPDNWGVQAREGYELKFYTDSSFTNEYTNNVMPQGNLTLYCREEQIIIVPETYTTISNKEDLVNEFNMLQINRIASKSFKLEFNYSSLQDLTNYIVEKSLQLYNYNLSVSVSGPYMTLNIQFDDIAYLKTNEVLYTQIDCINVLHTVSSRDANFNNFPVEFLEHEFEVRSSDALFYALENGYKPVIDPSDTDIISLYNSMKDVLRNIINNDMSDFEKARAIYEYIVMNVTYDGVLLTYVQDKQSDATKYRGFYLEGVFEDKVAVCDGISKAYAALCRIEGIKCVRVTGTISSNGLNHAWNKIFIEGNWYVVDCTSGGCIVGDEEVLTYSYFLISSEKYSSYAVDDGIYYDNYSCESNYDTYSKIMLGEISCKATTKEQAASLIKYLFDNSSSKTSLDIVLDFEYDDLSTLIDKLLTIACVSGKISYVPMLNSLTIIRAID